MRVSVEVPPGNDRGPQYMDQTLAGIHDACLRHLQLSFVMTTVAGQATLMIDAPDWVLPAVLHYLYAAYPDARVQKIGDPGNESTAECPLYALEMRLHPDLFPIKRYAQFEDLLNRQTADPIAALLAAISGRPDDPVHPFVAISVRSAHSRRRWRGQRCLHVLEHAYFRRHHRVAHWYARWAMSDNPWRRLLAGLVRRVVAPGAPHSHPDRDVSATRLHEREADLQAAADKIGRPLFDVHIRLIAGDSQRSPSHAIARLHEIAAAFGQFTMPRLATFHAGPVYRLRWLDDRFRSPAFLLSAEELATLWHPPTAAARPPALARVESREREPPVSLPTPDRHPDLAILGRVSFRDQSHKFGILPDDRRRHLALLGKTGMGKSTLLAHLAASDIRAGRGIALIDPHGDLADDLLRAIPKHRTNDVIWFDAADAEHPVAFNPLAHSHPRQRPLVASGILTAFKKLYPDFWGPRLEHVFRHALLAVLEVPGSTLATVAQLLGDGRFRAQFVHRIADQVVRDFWEQEFAHWPQRLQAEAMAPVQNKIGAFIASPVLRGILAQPRSALNLRRAMDQRAIVLVNLSKGRLGEDNSALLGSLLVSQLQLAAMSRADVPPSERGDFFAYVDEFQNFATESFATILSEARKYGLCLTLANQYLSQVNEHTLHALFGNVGSLVTFQVGATDAEMLAEQLAGDLLPEDLLRLPKFHAYARLLIGGAPSRPFSMRTLSPQQVTHDTERAEIIRRTSCRRHAGAPIRRNCPAAQRAVA